QTSQAAARAARWRSRRRELLPEAVLAAPVRVLHGARAEPREPQAFVDGVRRPESRVGPRDDVPIARCRRPVERLLQERPAEAAATVLGEQRSEEHTSELQSRFDLVCRLLLEKKKHLRIP